MDGAFHIHPRFSTGAKQEITPFTTSAIISGRMLDSAIAHVVEARGAFALCNQLKNRILEANWMGGPYVQPLGPTLILWGIGGLSMYVV